MTSGVACVGVGGVSKARPTSRGVSDEACVAKLTTDEGEGEEDGCAGEPEISRQWVALSRDVVPVNITCINTDDNRSSGDIHVSLSR